MKQPVLFNKNSNSSDLYVHVTNVFCKNRVGYSEMTLGPKAELRHVRGSQAFATNSFLAAILQKVLVSDWFKAH